MLCAKYDYKMDIAVKKEEAYQNGQQDKAEEVAKNAIAQGLSPEMVQKITGLFSEQVAELQKQYLNK